MNSSINSVATTTAAEAANANTNVEPSKKVKRTYSKFWSAVGKANRHFSVQLVKTNEAKCECLKQAAYGMTKDLQKFYYEFMNQAFRLTDSVRYCKAAEAAGCDPLILATHIVYQGSAKINKVLQEGLEQSGVLQHVELYKEAFLPADPQEFAK